MKKKLLLIITTLLFSTSCFKTRSELQGRINTVPEAIPLESQENSQTTPYSKRSIRTWDRLNEIEQQLQELRSEIEILQNQISQANYKDKNPPVNSLNKNYSNKAYEEALFDFEKNLKNLNKRLNQLEEKQKVYKKKSTKGSKKSTKKSVKNKTIVKKENILNFLHHRAEKAFKTKNWTLSIELYQKLRKNSKGKTYRQATYKIGEAFSRLGMKKEAQPFLEELVKKYPKTLEAKQAKIKLNQFYHQ